MAMTMTLKDVFIDQTKTLADALAPRPQLKYAVDGLFALPSLNIVYGAPGSLKSLIMADLAVCLAGGKAWLEPLPHDKSGAVKPIQTLEMPVLWMDFDNGRRRTLDRFAALALGHQVDEGARLYSLSMPSVPFDATKEGTVFETIDYVLALGARFIVIDNLLTISGGKDENSPEIASVMVNLRLLSERTSAAVVIIHHSRKDNGFRGKVGDDLRGHSSIRGAVDLALLVEREPGSDIITLQSTKTRDVDVEPIGALWTYTHKLGTTELETARFFGQRVVGAETVQDIETAIFEALRKAGKPLNQGDLVKAVKAEGIQAGRDRIRTVLERMANATRLKTSTGARGAVLYEY